MTLLPDIDVWSLFFGGMFRKSAFVLAVAVICLWRILDASRKKMVWQVAFLCLMGIAVDESTGLSRGAAGWVNAVLAPDESPLPETGGIVSSLSSSVGTPSQLSIGLLAAPSADINSRLLFRDIAMERDPSWFPLMLWLVGFVLVLTRILLARGLFLWLRRYCAGPEDLTLNREFARLTRLVGLGREPQLLLSPFFRSPVAFGVLSPTVGLPEDFRWSFNRGQRQAMMLHELGHFRNHDPLWYLAVDFCAAIFWWNPLVWWARRRFQEQCEFAADEASSLLERGPEDLAESLVGLGGQLRRSFTPALVGDAGTRFKSALGKRVARLLSASHVTWRPISRRSAFLTYGFSLATFASVLVTLQGITQPVVTGMPRLIGDCLQQSWSVSPVKLLVNTLQLASEPSVSLLVEDQAQTLSSESQPYASAVSTIVEQGLLTHTYEVNPEPFMTVVEEYWVRESVTLNLPKMSNFDFQGRLIFWAKGLGIEVSLPEPEGRLGVDAESFSRGEANRRSLFYDARTGRLYARAEASDLLRLESALSKIQSLPHRYLVKVQVLTDVTSTLPQNSDSRRFQEILDYIRAFSRPEDPKVVLSQDEWQEVQASLKDIRSVPDKLVMDISTILVSGNNLEQTNTELLPDNLAFAATEVASLAKPSVNMRVTRQSNGAALIDVELKSERLYESIEQGNRLSAFSIESLTASIQSEIQLGETLAVHSYHRVLDEFREEASIPFPERTKDRLQMLTFLTVEGAD